ncbi:MAG TPA: S9 family peptidase [Thermoanaerobaculia bacterium]|nr:S9 family peptidase [Thermoanaerobaculia bacterium]
MTRTLLAALLLAAPLPLAAAEPAATATPESIPVPEAIVVKNVPPIPKSTLDAMRPYQNSRSATLQDWHPTERRLLISTRFAETNQLHELKVPLGARTQLTFEPERILSGGYRPGHPEQLVYAMDKGGAENYQLYLLDRTAARTRRITDGVHRHQGAEWSHDGRLLAYTGNARNGRDMDLYVWDAASGAERRVAELEGDWSILDWSPDDRRLLLARFVSVHETYLHAVDVASGALQALTPRPEGTKLAYFDSLWTPDGRAVYTTTDRDSEFFRLVRLDPATGKHTVLSGDHPWDVEGFDVADDGGLIAYFTNEEGFGKLHLLETASGRELPAPELPQGVADSLAFRPGSREVAFRLSWARSPSDVYSYDPEARRLDRWTESEVGGLDASRFAVPELVRFPTFDETAPGTRRTIPAWVYRPSAERFPGPRPVLVSIHGGPEGQSRPGFQSANNYLVDEKGIVVIFPNVRGSTGYGKTYGGLDNATKREDSVKDIGALLDWIATQPDLDASRVMVSGGSYGGYMVLASLVHYGERLCCASESVGISDFTTFLENTQEYRRDLRRAEYGDERLPEIRAFFERISPRRQAAKIRRPLVVAQGANDPRVPLSESEEIVKAVEANGAAVWYVVGKNEGHGFAKKPNVDYLQAVVFEFMERHLLAPRVAAPAAPGGSPGQ